ncbi:hypothetical protein NKH77_20915 [Streptomyces sp. M19]
MTMEGPGRGRLTRDRFAFAARASAATGSLGLLEARAGSDASATGDGRFDLSAPFAPLLNGLALPGGAGTAAFALDGTHLYVLQEAGDGDRTGSADGDLLLARYGLDGQPLGCMRLRGFGAATGLGCARPTASLAVDGRRPGPRVRARPRRRPLRLRRRRRPHGRRPVRDRPPPGPRLHRPAARGGRARRAAAAAPPAGRRPALPAAGPRHPARRRRRHARRTHRHRHPTGLALLGDHAYEATVTADGSATCPVSTCAPAPSWRTAGWPTGRAASPSSTPRTPPVHRLRDAGRHPRPAVPGG